MHVPHFQITTTAGRLQFVHRGRKNELESIGCEGEQVNLVVSCEKAELSETFGSREGTFAKM